MKKVSFTTEGKRKLTKQEIEKKKQEVEKRFDFRKIIDEVDITADKYKVLLTLGDNELIYDDGEFYISETLNEKKRRKIARKYAQQIYVDYYMRYHINSDIQKAIEGKEKERGDLTKTKKKSTPTKANKEKKTIEPKGIAKKIIEEKEKKDIEGKSGKGKKSVEEELEIM